MNDAVQHKSTALSAALLAYYASEGTRLSVRVKLLARWLKHYPETWVRAALIESIYQGRYKTVSVEQVLERWQRRGQPVCHFNSEFARLVCQNIPRELARFPDEKRDHGFSRKSANKPELFTAPPEPLPGPFAAPLPSERNVNDNSLQDDTAADLSSIAEQHRLQDQSAAVIAQSVTDAILPELAISEWEIEPFESPSSVTDEGAETTRAFGNSGIESIHPFILEAEFDEFCEKLMAIATQPH
jgi:hypothetical protein